MRGGVGGNGRVGSPHVLSFRFSCGRVPCNDVRSRHTTREVLLDLTGESACTLELALVTKAFGLFNLCLREYWSRCGSPRSTRSCSTASQSCSSSSAAQAFPSLFLLTKCSCNCSQTRTTNLKNNKVKERQSATRTRVRSRPHEFVRTLSIARGARRRQPYAVTRPRVVLHRRQLRPFRSFPRRACSQSSLGNRTTK